MLEEFYYHSFRNSKYIQELRGELIKQGIVEPKLEEKELKLKEKHTKRFKNTLIFANKKIPTDFKEKNLWEKVTRVYGALGSNFTYTLMTGVRSDQTLGKERLTLESEGGLKDIKLKDMSLNIKRNALLSDDFYSFNCLQTILPNITSIDYFIESHLDELSISYNNAIGVVPLEEQFNALKGFFQAIKKVISSNTYTYEGSKEFEPKNFYDVFKNKTLKIEKDSEKANGQEEILANKDWYVFNANYGTILEKEFVASIQRLIDTGYFINYSDVYLVRNELQLSIHDFEQGRTFYPDFLLILKDKDRQDTNYQMFIEPKGDHLKDMDKWKNDFLKEITKHNADNTIQIKTQEYNILGIPFYEKGRDNPLTEALTTSLS